MVERKAAAGWGRGICLPIEWMLNNHQASSERQEGQGDGRSKGQEQEYEQEQEQESPIKVAVISTKCTWRNT